MSVEWTNGMCGLCGRFEGIFQRMHRSMQRSMYCFAICLFLLCGSSLSAAGDPLLNITKSVTYPDQSSVQLGDIVTFTVLITNAGTGVSLAPWFIDPLPSGLLYEPDSSLVSLDGAQFVPGGDPTVGFALPNMNPDDVVKLTFRATVSTFPQTGNHFENSAEVIYAVDTDAGPTVISSISDPIDVLVNLPDPLGEVTCCHLIHRTVFNLTITWDIPFMNIQMYNIFFDGELVAEVPGGQALFIQACLRNRCDASRYSVQAVYVDSSTTPVIPVRVL